MTGIITTLALEEDARALASVMTAAFSASDAAYPLIWAGPEAPEGIHDEVAIKGLFSPVQQEHRVTFKATDGGKLVGFATWDLPKPNIPKKEVQVGKEGEDVPRGLPDIPGVNTILWSEKLDGPKEAADRDADLSKDIYLSFFFVHPDYQRQGIGILLLQWGMKKADELNANIWLTSTPQAITTYERNGWETVQRYDVDLGKYGGDGIYSRAWMRRQPGRAA